MLRRDELWEDQYLVALDAADGSRRWERALDPWPGICMYSLTTGAGRLVLVSSGNGEFGICVFTAAEGQPSWEHRFPWATDNHGGHLSRPAVVGQTLFLRPAVFDLMTGQRRERDMAWGSCGTYACSAEAVFYRAGTVNMFAPATGQVTGWNNLRPDCWLSAIPACGMVLSPEGGGGCWCSGWLETSVGLRPVRYPAPLIEAPTHDFVGSLEIALTARGEVAALSGKHEWADPGKHLPTIHYTIDGSEPTPRSPRYTGPIVVRADETVLKARAFWDTANDCMVCSPVAVDVFRRQYPAPKFTRRRTCFGRPVAIAIAKEDSDGQIRYTTDGTDPTPQSPAYAGPIRLTDTTTLRAATFYAGDRTTDVAEMTYCHVEPLLIDGKEYLPGLRYKYFEEWWDKLPDFDALEPKATGYVDGFTLEPKQRDDAFALQLEGWLNVPTDGTYTFFLQSDDGSRLSIDGKQVVLNDGIHDARVVQSGEVELKAGLHPIRLDYFECFGGQELKVTWEGPKIERQPIPHTRLYQIESTNKE
jgi:hypothetical protein